MNYESDILKYKATIMRNSPICERKLQFGEQIGKIMLKLWQKQSKLWEIKSKLWDKNIWEDINLPF